MPKVGCNYQLTINHLTIDVVKKDIKNLRLGIYPPDGKVRITSPLKVDDETIKSFVIAKLRWITKNQAKFSEQPRKSPKEYVSGESHYFKGDRYLLNVIYHPTTPKVVISNPTHLDLYVRHGSIREQREQVLNNWYRQQLKAELPRLIAKWEQIIGVKTNDWGVKKMKTKWGTCNTQAKRIWLNLELIKKPPHCLEYVIVHELVHLLERNHGDRFKAYMTQFMPHWKSYQDELNTFPRSGE
ncbi:MAG: M48 family metallopeptidase [Hydrococcus sp. SU_1_0]|nr:M48 family metallopeptidase [Hydrococcus sp. SU_1_0]